MNASRVLYVAWTYPKLSETFVSNEVRGLWSQGVDVRVVTVGPGAFALPAVEEERVVRLGRRPGLPRVGDVVRMVRAPDDSALTRAWAAVAARSAVRKLGGWRPEVVHVHFIDKPAVLGIHMAAAFGCPLTITAHAIDFQVHVSPRVLAARVRAADRVFCISELSRQSLIERAQIRGLPEERRVQVVRAVALPPPAAPAAIDDRRPHFVSVARLVAKKGLDTAVRAMAVLAAAGVDAELVIVGDGPEREALGRLVADCGLTGRVRLLGPLDNEAARGHLAGAVAAVLPCRTLPSGDTDGIPVALIEAAWAAVPVVSTAVGGIPELVEHGTGGLLVPEDDPASLADAMRVLLQSPDTARSMGAALRRRAEEEFGIATQLERLQISWNGSGPRASRRSGGPKVLLVSSFAPWPLDRGDPMRVFGVTTSIAAGMDATLWTVRRRAAPAPQELVDAFPGEVRFFDPTGEDVPDAVAKVAMWVRGPAAGVPPWIADRTSPTMHRALMREAAHFDAIVLLGEAAGIYAKAGRAAATLIWDKSNVIGRSSETFDADRPVRRRVIGALSRRYERDVLSRVDRLVVTSPQEDEHLRHLYGRGADEIISSGVPIPPLGATRRRRNVVGLMGQIGYRPNGDGLARFLRDGWPDVADLYLEIIGPDQPSGELADLIASSPRVRHLGYLPSTDAWLATLGMAVIPLWAGAGVKVKTLAFMASGVPVVGTPTAAEGIAVVDGEHMLVREGPVDLARGCASLAANPAVARRIGARGREVVAREYSWPVVGERYRRSVLEWAR